MESGAFGEWRKIPKEQFTDNSRYLSVLPVVGILLLVVPLGASMWVPIVSYMLTLPVVMGMVILAQCTVAYMFPVFLMGRYKPGLYKEKLGWNAFREFLSDFSQMQRYSTEDLTMWGSWLVYGTALGVGDKVAQAMKSLNVRFPAAQLPVIAHRHFNPIITASRPVTYSAGEATVVSMEGEEVAEVMEAVADGAAVEQAAVKNPPFSPRIPLSRTKQRVC